MRMRTESPEGFVRTIGRRRKPVGAESHPGEKSDQRNMMKKIGILDVPGFPEDEFFQILGHIKVVYALTRLAVPSSIPHSHSECLKVGTAPALLSRRRRRLLSTVLSDSDSSPYSCEIRP